jgi:hypothetical protein
MTIRAKLYAAIVLTILGPVATTAVALHGMSEMGDRFDEVQERARHEAVARELKFQVTDMNGWQTAYGYEGGDGGRFRGLFVDSANELRKQLDAAEDQLTDDREQDLLKLFQTDYDRFMALDVVAYRALLAGDAERTKQIFLGPELRRFEAMAATSELLASYETDQASEADDAFDDARDTARRTLITVALGAGIVILLLLVTAGDVARLALEGERSARGEPPRKKPDKPRRDDRP